MLTKKIETLNIYEKLILVQEELKAPKNQWNKFGKYNYRSCEDILEALKPLLVKYRLGQTISDDIKMIGDRYYVEATVTLINIDNTNEVIKNTSYARESEIKKGMDSSQVTGASSSYSRKYALNGLYGIDDSKDFDDEFMSKKNSNSKTQNNKVQKNNTRNNINSTISKSQQDILIKIAKGQNNIAAAVIKKAGYNKSSEIKVKDFENICANLQDEVSHYMNNKKSN